MTKEEMKERLEKGLRTYHKPKCLGEKCINGKFYRDWVIVNIVTESADGLFSECEGSIFNVKYVTPMLMTELAKIVG